MTPTAEGGPCTAAAHGGPGSAPCHGDRATEAAEGAVATLVAEGLSKSFGEVQVLSGLDLVVRPGATVAVLVGASGSGKTTLLRLLAGLELPDAGRIYLDGRLASEPGWALAPHRRGIGFAFQRSALWPHMTVAQNIAFGLGDAPRDRVRESVGRLLAEMQLDGLADRYPDQLSGGQSRRVALARALAPEPRFLLLDEPLTNIEPELKKRLLTVVRGHAERTGACVVYVTHDADEAAATGGRTSILRDGRLSNRERD